MKSMKQSNTLGGLMHILVPILVFVAVGLLTYGATKIVLPEILQAYEIFFLILTAIASLFFMAITVPCGLYGGYLAVMAIIRDKKYVIPVMTLLLDCAALLAWVYVLRHFFLT